MITEKDVIVFANSYENVMFEPTEKQITEIVDIVNNYEGDDNWTETVEQCFYGINVKQSKRKGIKYFAEASAHFLTEQLTHKEFDKLLKDGVCLPTSDIYSDWDVDFLENAIKEVAETIEKEVSKVSEQDK